MNPIQFLYLIIGIFGISLGIRLGSMLALLTGVFAFIMIGIKERGESEQ